MLRDRYTPFNLTAFNQKLDHGLLLGLTGQGVGGGADDHGLGNNDSPTFAGLTLSGNLAMGSNDITGLDDLTMTGVFTPGTAAGKGVTDLIPSEIASFDLGNATYDWRNFYLNGNLSDGTNSLTVANAKDAYDHSQIAGGNSVHVSTIENARWDTAYTHISNNGSDHSYIDQSVVVAGTPQFASLGVGKAPTVVLDVLSTADGVFPFILTSIGAAAPLPGFVGRSARGTLGSETATQADDYLFVASGRGYDGSAYVTGSSAIVSLRAGENISSTNHGAYIAFLTTANGKTYANIKERVRIENNDAPGWDRVLRIGPGTSTTDDGTYIEFMASTVDGYGAQIGGIREDTGGKNALIFKTGTNSQAERMRISDGGNVGIGGITAAQLLDVAGAIGMLERSSDPPEPAEGNCVIWMSDGTGKGDDGDVLIASNPDGTTKWGTLFDYSGGGAW